MFKKESHKMAFCQLLKSLGAWIEADHVPDATLWQRLHESQIDGLGKLTES